MKLNRSSSLFVIISILVQLVSIPLVYAIFESIGSLMYDSEFGIDLYFLSFPIINLSIIFSVVIVTSVQEATKSELLATVMNAVWILFIFSETEDSFRNQPFEYILFILCLAQTIPLRIDFRRHFHIE